MKKRFTEQQIAFAPQQAASGTPVAEIIRKMGICEGTFYRFYPRFEHSQAPVGTSASPDYS